MSDDDRDIDIESDDETPSASPNFHTQADKRAHHNALERKRRDHIKDSFSGLRDSIPALQGEKASRAQILKKAAEYITFMRRKNQAHQQDIDNLKRQNQNLEQKIHLADMHRHDYPVRSLEKARTAGNFVASLPTDNMSVSSNSRSNVSSVDGGSESSDSESSSQSQRKKLKASV